MTKIAVLNLQDLSIDIIDVSEKTLADYYCDIEAYLSSRGYLPDYIQWMEGVNSINFIEATNDKGTEDESGS